jgi:hypothetical protein
MLAGQFGNAVGFSDCDLFAPETGASDGLQDG